MTPSEINALKRRLSLRVMSPAVRELGETQARQIGFNDLNDMLVCQEAAKESHATGAVTLAARRHDKIMKKQGLLEASKENEGFLIC